MKGDENATLKAPTMARSNPKEEPKWGRSSSIWTVRRFQGNPDNASVTGPTGQAQSTQAPDEIADVENTLSTSNNPNLDRLAEKIVMERRRRFQENPQEVDTALLDELDQLQQERTTYEKDDELTAEEIAKNSREYEELFPEILEEMRRHHDTGLCKSCRRFFKTSGCRHGSRCQHCHLRAQAIRQDCSPEKTGDKEYPQ